MWIIVLVLILVCVLFGYLASNEAGKQGRNSGKWFIIGIFFWINAFIALKVSSETRCSNLQASNYACSSDTPILTKKARITQCLSKISFA